ncbi:uncharacterized protein LOC5570374 [Aedes aegypti]|uniref:Uncharacterized protein n=1 Tax=Aedes aegypti TaxID=7159 RepID=A0A6I8TH27_AEDAE|nr:uncharacterized protein LOC110679054 [Aedes aegypti]XP_021708675.1 uncharacterized protein LOC5570374 [Aedes aegypti]
MKRSFVLISLASIISFILACDHPTKHYSSMGCTPNALDPETGCPLSYNCPNLSNRQDNQCHLNGKTYNIGETVPSEETSSSCIALASCNRIVENQPSKFIYAHIDCAEFFRPRKPGCVLQYKPASCCSSKEVCGKNKTRLVTCTIGETTFYEGERMQIPGKPCQTCICTADFNLAQTDSNEYCYEDKCSFEIFADEKLYGGAAPVFKQGFCCPWTWRMPKVTDKLALSSKVVDKSDQKCVYGSLTLEIGEFLEPINENGDVVNCKCAIPPLVHCSMGSADS